MTNKITKLNYGGNEYELPAGLPEGGTTGQILVMTDNGPAWATPTDVDIVMSDTNAPLIIRKIWGGTDADYEEVQTFDENEAYFTIPGQAVTGIYHNSSLGLITIVYADNLITIADKNLGATSNDITSTNSYGNFYQWGNNNGFAYNATLTTSSTQVDASGYGPGNYYSSSTWINYYGDWSSVQNDNLWGATTATDSARQGPCPSGYHVPTDGELANLFVTVLPGMGVSSGTAKQTYLKMPSAGIRDYTGIQYYEGTMLGVRCSTGGGPNNVVTTLSFRPATETYGFAGCVKAYGQPIRPFKNTPVAPDNTWTVLYKPGH